MTREELRSRLELLDIRPDAYSLSGDVVSEAYVLDEYAGTWRVYYSERGLRTGLKEFSSESEACEYFFSLLRDDISARRK